MKIIHVITGLNNGGAEAVLYRLCTHDKNNTHIVISLMDEGKYGVMLRDAGIEVHCINMPQGRFTLAGLAKLFRLFRNLKPNIVQTWMYHADLIGGVVAKLAGVKRVFWNIRHTTLEPRKSKRTTIIIAKLCAAISRFVPTGIVCCANKAKEVHSSLGYIRNKMTVIGNGYDLTLYAPQDVADNKIRDELHINDITPLLGMVGRFDPQKDHLGLLLSLSMVKKSGVNFKFCLIGRDLNQHNSLLVSKISELDLNDNMVLLDQRSDIHAVMNSLDIHVLSSSFGEGFPNVVAEAMACSTPCITTDVGDAALIVGDTGWIVPPEEPKLLAEAIILALDEKNNISEHWNMRKQNARLRIVQKFSIETMVKNYVAVWQRK